MADSIACILAIAVTSGLISSTALTLIVIPSVYMLVDEMKARALGQRSVAGATSAMPAGGGGPAPTPLHLR